MKRRLLAALLALVLALVGAVVLLGYARGADARALAGVQTVPVLVVTTQVAEGTPADQLADSVRTELVPAKVAAAGRVQRLADLRGQVATVALEPGEQLLTTRFASPRDLRTPGTVAVPAGDQEISILLDPQRAVGGRLKAGDEVGIYLSMKQGDGGGTTHAVLHHVLVTQVQGAPAAPTRQDAASSSSSGAAAPQQSLMVTFAVTAREAEAIVFGTEHASLWLSLEPEDADNGGTSVVTGGTIYTEAFQ